MPISLENRHQVKNAHANLMHKHIPKCKYTHINARTLDITVHMDKNIKMEDNLYAHTDEQTHQQANMQ